MKARGQEFQLPEYLSSLPQAQLHKNSFSVIPFIMYIKHIWVLVDAL
jgi:hypothetical protein